MKEFAVNKHLKLTLEGGETKIYVGGKYFRTCKYLLANTTLERLNNSELIDSIDDLEGELSQELEEDFDKDNNEIKKYAISPEDEFWGHCSNLEAWVKYNYNTKLLHRNLAFWLLHELGKIDDYAKIRFFEESAERYNYGDEKVREFLKKLFWEDFNMWPLSWLTMMLRSPYDQKTLEMIDQAKDCVILDIDIKEGEVIFIELQLTGKIFPDYLFRLPKSLKHLVIKGKSIEKIPDKFDNFRELEVLEIYETSIKQLPDSIGELLKLINLTISETDLTSLPETIGKLRSLKTLDLHKISINSLPNSIGLLKSLRKLRLSNLYLESISEFFGNLHNLEELEVLDCEFTSIPKSFGNLKNLRKIYLKNVKMPRFPQSITNLKKITLLIIIESPNFTFSTLNLFPNVKELILQGNNLKEIPAEISLMKSLRYIDVSDNPITAISKEVLSLPNLIRVDGDNKNNYIKNLEK